LAERSAILGAEALFISDRQGVQQTDWKAQALVEARRGEAMALFDTARGYNARNDQLVGLGVGLIGVAAGLGLKENLEGLLLAVPVALLLLFVYAIQLDNDIRLMGIARKRIEMVLEQDLGFPALIYESHVAQYREKEYIWSIEWVRGIVFAFAVGASGVGGWVANDLGGWKWLAVYLPLLLALWVCLARAVQEQRKIKDEGGEVERGLAHWAEPAR
jgi:hypothetical protein